jgi:hypothetical protein
MADQSIRFDPRFDGYVFEFDGSESRYRAVVPREMLDDEAGDNATEEERVAWVERHLPQIFGAVTAVETGGILTEPWNRVLVEEID